MKQFFTFFLLLVTLNSISQNPSVVKNVASSVFLPKDKDQNVWQNNLWNGKRFYRGTGVPVKLCVTDGTNAGTAFVTDLGTIDASIINTIPAKDFIYITTNRLNATFTQIITELWKSDGTAAGTSLIKSFDPYGFSVSGPSFNTDATNTFNYSVDGNIMYFGGYDVANGNELWRTDGTIAGTYMVKDIKPGTGPAYVGGFTKIGTTTMFRAAAVGFGTTLWKTDGTTAGTLEITVAGMTYFEPPAARVNNKLIFIGSDAATGAEPWVSDGTPEGTFLLADINPGTGRSLPTVVQNLHLKFNDKYAFFIVQIGSVKNLWRTDGTSAGTIKLSPDGMITEDNFSGGGYSVIDNNGLWWIGANEKLYFSDGTVAGTRKVTSTLSNAQYMCLYKNAAWFHARNADRLTNGEPFRSDGTAANTNRLEVVAGEGSSYPYGFFELNNKLYFFGDNGAARNLYQYNGDMTFNGSVAGNRWRDSANWNSFMPPGITDTAFIPAGFNVNISGRNAYAGTLIMGNGSTINVTAAPDSIFIHNNLQGTNSTGNGTIVLRNFNGDTVNITTPFIGGNINVDGFVSLNANLTINANLNLTNNARLIANNSNVLLTGTSSTITNTANNYIVTNGLGKLRIENIGPGGRTGNVVFPIGSSTNYNPTTISNPGAMDVFAARTEPGIKEAYTGEIASGNNYTMGAVNNTWLISEGTPGGSVATITLQWNASQELPGFNRTLSQFGHYINGSWTAGPPTPAIGTDPYTIIGTGVTSFSPFGVLNSSALPLTSAQLTVAKTSVGQRLQWKIIATNAASIGIERSANGVHFTNIYSRDYIAESNYVDAESATLSKVYYRLKVTDQDGKTSFTNVVHLNLNSRKLATVYPTLFTNNFTVQNQTSGQLRFKLYQTDGKIHMDKVVTSGTNVFNTSQLSSGLYMYRITDGNNTMEGKIIKQ